MPSGGRGEDTIAEVCIELTVDDASIRRKNVTKISGPRRVDQFDHIQNPRGPSDQNPIVVLSPLCNKV